MKYVFSLEFITVDLVLPVPEFVKYFTCEIDIHIFPYYL